MIRALDCVHLKIVEKLAARKRYERELARLAAKDAAARMELRLKHEDETRQLEEVLNEDRKARAHFVELLGALDAPQAPSES